MPARFSTDLSAILFPSKESLKGNWLDIGGEVAPQKVEIFDSTTITFFKADLKRAGRNLLEWKWKT